MLSKLAALVSLAGAGVRRRLGLLAAIVVGAALVDFAAFVLVGSVLGRLMSGGNPPALPSRWQFAGFIACALVASSIRLVAVRLSARVQAEILAGISSRAFEKLQFQRYADYIARGGAETFAVLDKVQQVVVQSVNPLVNALAGAAVALVLSVAVVVLLPLVLTATVFATIVAAAAMTFALRGRRHRPSKPLSEYTRQRMALVYRARTAFREIFLGDAQAHVTQAFAENERQYRAAQAQIVVAGQSPRFILEIAALIGCGTLALLAIGRPSAFVALVPGLGMLTFALLRILPGVGAMQSAIWQLRASIDLVDDVLAALTLEGEGDVAEPGPSVRLADRLVLEAVALGFADRPNVLRDIDLIIVRGERVGVIGPSGSGKSSLLDVLSGAIPPSSGRLAIDGRVIDTPALRRSWRRRIGFVSQSVLLAGETIGEAILFPQSGPDTDGARLARVLAQTGLDTVVAGLPRGLDTPLGDSGIRLSGGQRQRVALARALYRDPDLLIVDEGTGQLDREAEDEIVSALARLDRAVTIVLVSHGSAPLRLCETVYRMEDGRLRREQGVVPLKPARVGKSRA